MNGIEEIARRAGRCRWAETRLAGILGEWVGSVPEADVVARLGAHGHKHAWHADLWHDRIPALRGIDADDLTTPANEALVRVFDAVSSAGTTVEKLVGVYRVLIPRFIATYARQLDDTSEILDPATHRSLRFILLDEIDDCRDGEALLQSLLTTPDATALATEHQARIEALMSAAGGITGDDAD